MKKIFLATLIAFLGSFALTAQVGYEDFEGGVSDLPWTGLNGTYDGVIANPDQSGVNTSAFVGSFTNNPSFDFCFALVNIGAPADLSDFNQIKMKVWSPTAPTQVLFKFEGGGNAVEKFQDITVANQWVEYTFDLSGGAAYTGLNTILVSFNPFVLGDDKTYYFDDIVAVKAEQVIEDYETPSGITWSGINGVYNGTLANPAPNQVNNSSTVGSFSNNPAFDFNFALGVLPQPLDLTVYNQFHFQVWAPEPTQVLFKLEGGGQFIEKFVNIAVADKWQEYTVDFSAAAAYPGLDKILIVYSPFLTGSSDTFYVDNIYTTPNPCPGIADSPDVLDDFDCNRNAVYGLGWDSLTVIKNPFQNGDNNSRKVGRVNDAAGPGTEYYPLVIDYENPIDLTTHNQFTVQVWPSKAGTLLLKIEGGVGFKETPFQMVANEWNTFTLDCSDQAGKGHKRFVMFFNAGVNGEPGDVYYIDNITLTPPSALPPLEDFEQGQNLGWQPLDQNNVLHGIFTGPTPNPHPNLVNNSAQVGCYTLGVSPFSTLQAFSLTNFDLSAYAQFNIDVLSPPGGGTVVMQLSSPTQGNKEADAEISTPGEWETLGFDFSAFNDITDFAEVRLLFNPATAAPGASWCVDNLRQSEVTVDPCAGVVPVPNIIEDYECQRNYSQVFIGASQITVVNNPHLAPENGSLKVGKYIDPDNEPWAGIGFEFASAPDLSVLNQLQMQIWSTAANVPVLFKLEGSGPAVEIWDTVKVANKWHKFKVDFSQQVGTGHNKLVIFVNAGSDVGGTYFIDNVKWSRAGYNGCINDYQTAASSISNFKYFANGHLEQSGYQFEVVDNPNPAGINTSSKVGKFVKASDGAPFAGMYADLEAPIDWKGLKQIKAKVHMDHIGNFAVKLEGDAINNAFIELPVANTAINSWEELTYNFSVVPDNSEFMRLTLFFDLGIDATGQDVTSYFDDIVVGNGACGTVAVFNPLPVEPMVVAPNPVSDFLMVENFRDVNRLEVYNLFGQRVAATNTSGDLRTFLDVSRFPAGVYTLAGFNRQGVLIGKAKFIKQ